MSYVDTGDDELDYGEGELGDAATAGVSLGAPADDDEMAQEDEYDDLYDDVNIGFFEAPALDVYGSGALDQNPDVKPTVVAADLDTRAIERTRLDPSLAPTAGKPSEAPLEAPKGLKIEPKEEVNDDKAISARQEMANRNPGQQKESVFVPSNATEIGQGRQLQLFLTPSAKEQGAGYNNGVRQVASHVKAPSVAPLSGDGERVSGSVAVPHTARLPGSGFSVGLSRPAGGAGENFKERCDAEDLSYDRTPGPTSGVPRTAQRELPPNMADNTSRQLMGSESRPMMQQSYSGDGNGMIFVGDLQWWTTDAELEAALSEYGRVKNLKFYEERVSGKSKGYCQVEFFDHASAVACKQGMNGRKFHDRPCIVALGNSKSIQQMGYQQEKKTQAQFQAQQEQMTTRRNNNSNIGGARGGPSYQDRDSSRGYGRTGTGRIGHAQGMGNKTGQGGGRGRGNYMNKGMGGGGGSGMPYGQGHSGPMGGHQSAMMMHQGMMGQGYDPAYGPMGRGGAGYGGYVMPGPPFPGMVTPFPSLGPGGLPGVAPHVNPAFFGRPNGMGMMPGGSMEVPHQGMWGDASLGGWGGEEHDRRARDGSYGEDGGGMDYSYNSDIGHEKSRTSGGWDKENGGLPERHRRDDRDGEWERDVYKERDRDAYRDRERIRDRDEDWDRERTVKSRNKSRIAEEEDDPRLRSREDDYGRKRRVSDRELSNMTQPVVEVEIQAGISGDPCIWDK